MALVGTDKIQRDENVYTFISNINDSIVVYRNNIVIDGAGYTLQGFANQGIDLQDRNNVTIKNLEIKEFGDGIYLGHSSNNNISGNTIRSNSYGILLLFSSNNVISGNTITSNRNSGIWVSTSSNNNSVCGNYFANNGGSSISFNDCFFNNVSGNDIRNNYWGIVLNPNSNYNIICGNNITGSSKYGIYLCESSNNSICHNNFMDNAQQIYDLSWDYPEEYPPSINFWDDGYPSGGNFWSDYTDVDQYSGPNQSITGSDGIWDHPYEIDENNIDHYPIVPEFPTWTSTLLMLIVLIVAIAIYKRRLLKTPIH